MLIPKSCLGLECGADRLAAGLTVSKGPRPGALDVAAGTLGRAGRRPGCSGTRRSPSAQVLPGRPSHVAKATPTPQGLPAAQALLGQISQPVQPSPPLRATCPLAWAWEGGTGSQERPCRPGLGPAAGALTGLDRLLVDTGGLQVG